MNNSIQKYTTYKPSGVEWLGEIPQHWEVSRLGLILNSVTEKNRTDLPLLSITREKGVILRDLDNEEENHNFIPDDLSNYKVLKKGEFGMNKMKAWQGSYGISDFDGIVSPAYYTFILEKNLEPAFFHVSIRSKLYISFFGSASDGVRIGQWDLSRERMKQIPFLIPPLTEQTRIAEFLDRKTAQIDQAVTIKEKQIALLKERRQVLIHRAVTRGINPEVKLKPSGVEWIGDIPEHWEIQPIKYSLNGIVDCEHSTAPFVSESEYFVVRTSNVKNGELISNDAKYTHEKGYIQWTRRGIPKVGDVLLTREAPAGEACLVPRDKKICLGQRMVWLKIDIKKLNPQFLIYIIYSKIGRTYIDYLSAGSTVLHLNMSDIKNIPIMSIPIKEQNEIVLLIENLSQKIATAINLKQQEIEKLKEYKSTLINSAVTGKVKIG